MSVGNSLEQKHVSTRGVLPWLALIFVVVGVVLLRYRLLGVALERDEGEYAYGGQLLLQGIPPYQLLYNMKLPGIYAVYAGIMWLFGQTVYGIHLGLLLANIVSVVLLYLLGRQLLSSGAAVASAACFGVLAVGQPVQGVFANSEHFVILPMLAGMLLLIHNRKGNLFLLGVAGFLLGLSFVIKQHGVFFVAWGGLFVLLDCLLFAKCAWRQSFARVLVFGCGVFVPYILTCLLLTWAGVFDNFWFWTIDYARSYAAPAQSSWAQVWDGLQYRVGAIVKASPLICFFVVLGIPCFIFSKMNKRSTLFVVGFLLFSVLAICPGFYFRPHYFILLLPVASLLFGAVVYTFGRRFNSFSHIIIMGAILVATLLSSLYLQRTFLFDLSPAEVVSSTYWPNPFNESIQISQELRKISRPSDRLAIIGSEPQIYFYSGLKSASGYIYMYPLMETHDFALQMQREMIDEVEEVGPEFMIFVRNPYSWLQKKESHLLVYEWFSKYKENYERVGMVEIFENSSKYSWRDDIEWPPKTPYWLEILRKK